MSELKPLVFSISDLAYVDEAAVKKNFENPHDHAVYKATEADKVIEELEDKMLQYKVLYKEMCRDVNTQERFFAQERAHNKYKRCLAMAKWCLREYLNCDKYKITYWLKWHKRWLEIAEKFKEAKFNDE